MRQFWINGIPLCLFLTNKDHNYLNAISSATNTRTLMFITQETPLPQKKANKTHKTLHLNPKALRYIIVFPAPARLMHINYSKAVNLVCYCGIFSMACLGTIQAMKLFNKTVKI